MGFEQLHDFCRTIVRHKEVLENNVAKEEAEKGKRP